MKADFCAVPSMQFFEDLEKHVIGNVKFPWSMSDIPVKIDPNMPRNEIHMRNHRNEVVARIILEEPQKEEGPFNLEDYHNAPSGVGPLADMWADKPHRLVYDLIRYIENGNLRADCPAGDAKEPRP